MNEQETTYLIANLILIFQLSIFIPVWRIFIKIGRNPLTSLWLVIPGGFIIVMFLFNQEWPSVEGEKKGEEGESK